VGSAGGGAAEGEERLDETATDCARRLEGDGVELAECMVGRGGEEKKWMMEKWSTADWQEKHTYIYASQKPHSAGLNPCIYINT
jgi:hypothetical protein